MIDREIVSLEENFSGLLTITRDPDAVFIVDPDHEGIALSEANQLGIHVISLSSSDCDHSQVQYPIPGNDSNQQSISYVVNALAESYRSAR